MFKNDLEKYLKEQKEILEQLKENSPQARRKVGYKDFLNGEIEMIRRIQNKFYPQKDNNKF